MDEKGFHEFVKKGERVPKNMPEETVRSNIRMVREFERFLRTERAKKGYDDAKERDVRAFIKHLAKDDRSTFDNLIGLLRYARFRDNRDAELALLVILDGSSILGILCDTVKSEHGEG
ncbi:MAG: phage integrase N-terminal SAM-like domain-containing protein, partial [Thermoplasmata archaeon]|nr:phage integrase N-terminal SAM-like domain-containing protein [Thermoplasmata archaeon]